MTDLPGHRSLVKRARESIRLDRIIVVEHLAKQLKGIVTIGLAFELVGVPGQVLSRCKSDSRQPHAHSPTATHNVL